jgi:hypothetical protein|tara:strand:- start:4012 stop:4206 length:195 start_codon:yes stop_codon:yes gene_type:complete
MNNSLKILMAFTLFVSVAKVPAPTINKPLAPLLQFKDCRDKLFKPYPVEVNLIQWRKCMDKDKT